MMTSLYILHYADCKSLFESTVCRLSKSTDTFLVLSYMYSTKMNYNSAIVLDKKRSLSNFGDYSNF